MGNYMSTQFFVNAFVFAFTKELEVDVAESRGKLIHRCPGYQTALAYARASDSLRLSIFA